jgi:DNA polymerase III epsilon subunit-like protein
VPINDLVYIVVDFETGGRNPHTAPPIQLAALAIDPRRLAPIPGATFASDMHPVDFSLLQQEALDINHFTHERMRAAPPPELVMERFEQFVRPFNPRGKSPFTAPILVGHNLVAFDRILMDRLCKKHKLVDKGGNPNLFHQRTMVDTLHLCHLWLENLDQPRGLSMDKDLRPYFGLPLTGAHDARIDVRHTAAIFIAYLKLHRQVATRVDFKGVLARSALAQEVVEGSPGQGSPDKGVTGTTQ